MTNHVHYDRVRLILLDAGGTLVRSDFRIPELLVEFGTELGLDLELDRVQDAYAEADARYQLVYTQLIFRREFEKLERYWFDFGCHVLTAAGVRNATRYARPLHHRIDEHIFGDASAVWTVYDDVLPVLKEARLRGLALGVVSNWDHTLHRVLDLVGIRHYFDVVLASMEVGSEKPDKKIFKRALKMVGVPACEAIHIGDAYDADIVGSAPLGITPFLIDRDNAYPDAECIRLTDLRQIWDYL